MNRILRIAAAAMAAAMVAACGDGENSSAAAGTAAICSGRTPGYWASEAGRAEIVPADLAYLGTFDVCDPFGPVDTKLAELLIAGESASAPPLHQLCAQWFAFALNARHGRFACDGMTVRFGLANGALTFAEVEDAVSAALAAGSPGALTGALAGANGGGSVCVCTSGGTGATGGTGSWGE